jgi:metal-sulfur cluster biosynthetic enzyme
MAGVFWYHTGMEVTPELVKERLAQIIDPELNIDIISLGLIYDVTVNHVQAQAGKTKKIHIVMTLTTPGCPLVHVFERRVKEVLEDLPGIDSYRDVYLELTFDPPWIPDMMTEEARAELGF